MVFGSMSIKRKIFHQNPGYTMDNYFVMDAILDWSGNDDIGIIGTNARNRLPKDIKMFYLHK